MNKSLNERVTAAFALVHYCKAEGIVSVAEAAAHFESSEKWIRETMKWIFMTGLPQDLGDPTFFDFNWDAFEDDDLIEMRDIPALQDATVKLTAREAAVIITGLQMLVRALPDQAVRIEKLVTKIRDVTMGRGDLTMAVQGLPVSDELRLVRSAIREGACLSFSYRKPSAEAEQRHIRPDRIVIADDERILVQAYDLDRMAERTFRLDRASDLQIFGAPSDARFVRVEQEAAIESVEVEADAVSARQLQAFVPDAEVSTTGMTRLSIPVWNLETVLRAVMATGGGARVIAPESAVARLTSMVASAMR